MILILIFAEALGLYGLIVAFIFSQNTEELTSNLTMGLWGALSGLVALVVGMAIGIVGDAGVGAMGLGGDSYFDGSVVWDIDIFSSVNLDQFFGP